MEIYSDVDDLPYADEEWYESVPVSPAELEHESFERIV
ncbi:unknown [Haloarcula marismortui ATCC 43049]|uniref:Uncharacterized protein n=1 Tax=Haloarcula marismortui (strain ATCC 43049 / DSM 3752 / JCM 8966 / VKM B-1809) TaxID=272569 RepID=Q5V262_HALMA|nr:unknown [Haloarcula marismortui ATCC 43049]